MTTDNFYVFRHLHRIDDDSAEPPQSNPIHAQWAGKDIGRDEKKRLALKKLRKDYEMNPYLGNLPSRIMSDQMIHRYLRGTINRIVSSPFLRCIQTSLYLANLFGINQITIDYRLSEFGQAIDPLHLTGKGFIQIDEIFDQSMAYISKFCQAPDSKTTYDPLVLDPISVVPDHEKEIFKSMLYDAKDNKIIHVINQKDAQQITAIARDESNDAYDERLRMAIEELQSNGTLIVTHSGGMKWKIPNFYMDYNQMHSYPVSNTSVQYGSSYTYHLNKQKYILI